MKRDAIRGLEKALHISTYILVRNYELAIEQTPLFKTHLFSIISKVIA